MTIDIATATPVHRARVGERLHELLLNELRIDTDDVLVTVHADSTMTMQLAQNITRGDEPVVQTLSLPRGHYGFVGSYGDAPGLSIDLHRNYAAEVDDASIRRDALAILDRTLAELPPATADSQSLQDHNERRIEHLYRRWRHEAGVCFVSRVSSRRRLTINPDVLIVDVKCSACGNEFTTMNDLDSQ